MLSLQETVDPADTARHPQIVRDLVKLFDAAKTEKPAARPEEDKYAWFREHAASDPVQLARRVRAPALVLNGERDSLVLPHHAVELARALAAGGNRGARLRVFPNLTHVFTPSTLDRTVTADQSAEISEEFLRTLSTWMSATLGAAAK